MLEFSNILFVYLRNYCKEIKEILFISLTRLNIGHIIDLRSFGIPFLHIYSNKEIQLASFRDKEYFY